jgi:diguanylate cyclase (GGDEF)-like protein
MDSERTRVTRHQPDANVRRELGNQGNACIVVIYGSEIGRRVTLGTAPFEIGRSSKNDLFIDQESVSRAHARVSYDGAGGYSICDLGSTNGTFVNDTAVKERVLNDGDQIHIGRSILKFMTGENIEAHYHEEIYRLMTVDALTQAYNRRYFDEAIERELNRARRYARPLTLILFDIDHFKKINDTHGHLAGDGMLRQLSAAVKSKLRREDIFARIGGEEFAVILPEIDLDGARRTGEKIRAVVERSELKFEQTVLPCTISVGIAELMADDPGAAAVYARSDEALYAAKNTGRNRVAG